MPHVVSTPQAVDHGKQSTPGDEPHVPQKLSHRPSLTLMPRLTQQMVDLHQETNLWIYTPQGAYAFASFSRQVLFRKVIQEGAHTPVSGIKPCLLEKRSPL